MDRARDSVDVAEPLPVKTMNPGEFSIQSVPPTEGTDEGPDLVFSAGS